MCLCVSFNVAIHYNWNFVQIVFVANFIIFIRFVSFQPSFLFHNYYYYYSTAMLYFSFCMFVRIFSFRSSVCLSVCLSIYSFHQPDLNAIYHDTHTGFLLVSILRSKSYINSFTYTYIHVRTLIRLILHHYYYHRCGIHYYFFLYDLI